jgi:hypothetical protein
MSPRSLKHAASAVLLIGVLLTAGPTSCSQEVGPTKLSTADQKSLDGLFEQFLFDPRGAQRVEVTITERTVRGDTFVWHRLGWHVPAKGRVLFTDGANMQAPPGKAMSNVDFVAACKSRLAEKLPSEDEGEPNYDEQRTTRQPVAHDLILAAWLHRLGHEELAARLLARRARTDIGIPRARTTKAATTTTAIRQITVNASFGSLSSPVAAIRATPATGTSGMP